MSKNSYLTKTIETTKKIEASPFTADELNGLRETARRSELRALGFDRKMDLTNKALAESELRHDVADKAFDLYNDAMKAVQTFAAV